MNWIVESIFLAICIGLGRYQAYRFDVLQKRISHLTWGALYAALLVPVWLLTRNIWLISACVCMRIAIFNPVLNYFRIPRRAFFNTNPVDQKGSWLDKIYGRYYPVVYFVSLGLLIYLQFRL